MRDARRWMLWLAGVVMAAGCTSAPPVPPSVPPEPPRRSILPRSFKMKLAVFNFVDQTRSAGTLTETVPDILSTALFKTGRFELMERAEVRAVDSTDIKKIRTDYQYRLDALVVGAITRFNPDQKTMTVDVRVMVALNGRVLDADSYEVKYAGILNPRADRDDVERIADRIEKAIPTPAGGRVLSRSGERITIDRGAEDGVKRGLGVLIVARGDTVFDTETGDPIGSKIYIGEAYVIAVEPRNCEAQLSQYQRRGRAGTFSPNVKVGDGIVFK